MGGGSEIALVLKNNLQVFKNCSGQEDNEGKVIFFATTWNMTKGGDTTHHLVSWATLPVRYLGLPLITTRLRFMGFMPLLDKVASRIQG